MDNAKPRARFDSAHAIALLALFVALSGVAYASVSKNSVKSKHIVNGQVKTADLRNNAVKTNKVKDGNLTGSDLADDTVTGTQIKESTVGTVSNADKVDGQHARVIRYSAETGSSKVTVMTLGHLTIEAGCSAGGDLAVAFETSRNNSVIHVGSVNAGNNASYAEDDDLDVGQTVDIPSDDGVQGTFTFYSPAGLLPLTQPGHTISGTYLAEENGTSCLFVGNAIGTAGDGIVFTPFPRGKRGADLDAGFSGSDAEDG